MINGLPLGLALATGVNTYLPLFILALFARLNSAHIHLSPPFHFLTSDAALIVLGSLAACEILAQKFPGLDNIWDFVHTLLRPVAGAVAAGAAVNTDRILEMGVVCVVGAPVAGKGRPSRASGKPARGRARRARGAQRPVNSGGRVMRNTIGLEALGGRAARWLAACHHAAHRPRRAALVARPENRKLRLRRCDAPPLVPSRNYGSPLPAPSQERTR